MRVVLAELAPAPGDVGANLERLRSVVSTSSADLIVFPELFLSGYRVGDRMHQIALHPDDATVESLLGIAHDRGAAIAVGTPWAHPERPGEVQNAALLVAPDGGLAVQVKRYLPNYGPFEEASTFTPTDRSDTATVGRHRIGLEICYDAFFPEVTRALALAGADLFVVLSAAPTTSGRLFQKVLPARAVENAAPLVYVNRVGVEDGIVFGGGSTAYDARGEPVESKTLPLPGGAPEEKLLEVELDLDEHPRWRPFRPVLRDVATRPPAVHRPAGSTRTDHL